MKTMENIVERVVDRRIASSEEFEFLVQFKHVIDENVDANDASASKNDGTSSREWISHKALLQYGKAALANYCATVRKNDQTVAGSNTKAPSSQFATLMNVRTGDASTGGCSTTGAVHNIYRGRSVTVDIEYVSDASDASDVNSSIFLPSISSAIKLCHGRDRNHRSRLASGAHSHQTKSTSSRVNGTDQKQGSSYAENSTSYPCTYLDSVHSQRTECTSRSLAADRSPLLRDGKRVATERDSVGCSAELTSYGPTLMDNTIPKLSLNNSPSKVSASNNSSRSATREASCILDVRKCMRKKRKRRRTGECATGMVEMAPRAPPSAPAVSTPSHAHVARRSHHVTAAAADQRVHVVGTSCTQVNVELTCSRVLLGCRILLPASARNTGSRPLPATVTSCTADGMLRPGACGEVAYLLQAQCADRDQCAEIGISDVPVFSVGNACHEAAADVVRCLACGEVHSGSEKQSAHEAMMSCFEQKDELEQYHRDIPRPKYPEHATPGKRASMVNASWTASTVLRRKLPDLLVSLHALHMAQSWSRMLRIARRLRELFLAADTEHYNQLLDIAVPAARTASLYQAGVLPRGAAGDSGESGKPSHEPLTLRNVCRAIVNANTSSRNSTVQEVVRILRELLLLPYKDPETGKSSLKSVYHLLAFT
eukprot:m.641182 g.641182  ORF g.641182 m.641182 type:complete len:656 (-) comp22627_c0_seq3:267-2234(-)